MRLDATLASWLRLTLIPGIGGETQRRLLSAFGLPEQIFAAGYSALRGVIGDRLAGLLLETDNRSGVDAVLAWAEKENHSLLTLNATDYPRALLELADPPSILYVNGRQELLQRPALAIVGSRNPTPQGIQNAECFADALARTGLVIASGMALGVDTAAHRATLAAGGDTVAFIGTGIDRVYPSRNRDLALSLSAYGCIVSEFPLGTPAIASNFPRRNRLISGIAQGTLVVEASIDSGSLITARLAADQGREVFAIPGSIHSPQSRGCHKLIKQGAKLVETVQDVLDELAWLGSPALASASAYQAGETAPDTLLEQIGFDPCSIDLLAERSGLTIEALSARLLQMEFEGLLAQLPGGIVQRLRPR